MTERVRHGGSQGNDRFRSALTAGVLAALMTRAGARIRLVSLRRLHMMSRSVSTSFRGLQF